MKWKKIFGNQTNQKNTIYGTTQDGKNIVSARKIKGELIGGYILFDIVFGVVMMIVTGIILAAISGPLSNKLLFNTNVNEVVELTKTISIVTIILSVVTAPMSLLTVFCSSKVTFSKNRARRQDANGIIKVVIIYQIIIFVISLIYSICSYSSQMGKIDDVIKTMETINSYTTSLNSEKSYTTRENSATKQQDNGQMQGYIDTYKEIKGNYLIDLLAGIVANVVVGIGCVYLQKKLLNDNVVEV